MTTRPYTKRFVDLRPDLSDPSLVGAWGCKAVGNQMVDLTPYGHSGTCGANSVHERTILGMFRRYGPNSGAKGTVLGAGNSFPLNDVTMEAWYRKDAGSVTSDFISNYIQSSVTDGWGIWINGTSLRIHDDIDNAGLALYSTTVPNGKLIYVCAIMDNLENKLYIDGRLVGSGTFASDNWASFAGQMFHGDRSAGYPTNGTVGPLAIYNEAKSADWVAAQYARGARAIQFATSWGVKSSIAASESAGMYLGYNSSPFNVISGTWKMSVDSIEGRICKVMECVTDGVIALPTNYFEATPTEAAFGSWNFWTYKTDAGVIDVDIIASSTTVSGYSLQHAADESLVIREVGVGNVATGGTASHSEWHNHFISRRYNGLFTGYVDGVSWGSGTDLTTTTASYVLIEADAGCKIGYSDVRGGHNFVKYLGELVP